MVVRFRRTRRGQLLKMRVSHRALTLTFRTLQLSQALRRRGFTSPPFLDLEAEAGAGDT